jgi:hypothetical protein
VVYEVSWCERIREWTGAQTLPIFCLFCAPTGGLAGHVGATTGNSQLFVKEEVKRKLATGIISRQQKAKSV